MYTVPVLEDQRVKDVLRSLVKALTNKTVNYLAGVSLVHQLTLKLIHEIPRLNLTVNIISATKAKALVCDKERTLL